MKQNNGKPKKKEKLISVTTSSDGAGFLIMVPTVPKMLECSYCHTPTPRSSGICTVCIGQFTQR